MALLLALAVMGASGCGNTSNNLVTGTFHGGKLIALNYWVGGNSVGQNIDAYADVPNGTPAQFMLSGPQQWTCTGVMRSPTYVPATGGLFETEQAKKLDQVAALPMFTQEDHKSRTIGSFTLLWPHGDWKVTIEIPTLDAEFSHTWNLGVGESPDVLDVSNPACSQVALTLTQQRKFVDAYLNALRAALEGISIRSVSIHDRLRSHLDQATQSMLKGDAEEDPMARAADYTAAAASLTAMADLTSSTPGIDSNDAFRIMHFARNSVALLSQTGLG